MAEMKSLVYGTVQEIRPRSTREKNHTHREGVEVVFCPDGWNANTNGPSRGKGTGGEVKTQFVLKQDLLSFLQTENKKFLHSAETEILCQVLEWARNNPPRCGPPVPVAARSKA